MIQRLDAWLGARAWHGPAALVLLILLAFATSVHPGYVAYDSDWLVADNPLLSSGDLAVLPTLLFDLDRGTRLTLGAEYLPVRDLTVLADFALFDRRWALHHLVSVGWYAAGCVVLLHILQSLLGRGSTAWLLAALYALHPVHVESVAWLADRKAVVGTTLSLAAVAVWLRQPRRSWTVATSVLLVALGTWAKNTGITIPGVLVLLSLLHERQDARRWQWWAGWLPFAAVVLVALGISLQVGAGVGMYAEHRGGSLGSALLLQCRVVLRYLGLLAWPVGLSPLYAEPTPEALGHPLSLLGLGGVLALGVVAVACIRRAPLVTLGLGFFAVTLLPVSQLVPIQNLVADRYLMLPSAGIAIALGGAWRALPWRWQRPVAVGALAALLPLGLSTARQSLVWHDDLSLWARVVAVEPLEPRGHAFLATAQAARGDLATAEATLRAGLGVLEEDGTLLQELGRILMLQGRVDEARTVLEALLAREPWRRKAATSLMALHLRTGNAQAAVEVGRSTTELNPLYPEAWSRLGVALLELRQLDEAQEALDKALALRPYDAGSACNQGSVAWLREDLDAAERWWRRCLELDPGQNFATRGLQALQEKRAAGQD